MTRKIPTALLTACAALLAQGVCADDAGGFYAGAGAGFSAAAAAGAPLAPATDTTSAFGGYRFNSRFGVEGFYSDFDAESLPADTSGNLYTRSFLGNGGEGDATIASVSAIAILSDEGPVKPFARAGVHYYRLDVYEGGDLQGDLRGSLRGDNLLLGAGADVDLSRRWRARFEWERYTGAESLQRDIFSARFEYAF